MQRSGIVLTPRHKIIDVEFIQCYTLSHAPSGHLGFVIEAGATKVSNVRAWEMFL